jgi:hypothetical protein
MRVGAVAWRSRASTAGNRVRRRSGDRHRRCRSDVDRQEVEWNRGARAEADGAAGEVKADRLVEHRPDVREPAQHLEIDVGVVA